MAKHIYVYSGVTSSNLDLIRNNFLYISSGGTAINTTANGGWIDVYYGGVAKTTVLNSGGLLGVHSGGTASNILVYSGATLQLQVTPETYAQGTCLGSAFVLQSGYLSGFAIDSGMDADLNVSSGGRVENIVVNRYLDLDVGGNGYAHNITVDSDGKAWVNASYVESGGSVIVDKRGKVEKATINSGGTLYINDGIADDLTVNSGGFLVFWGYSGTATNAEINSGGAMIVSRGNYVSSATVHDGGAMIVSSGGTALGIKEDGGFVHVESGAEVSFVKNSFDNITLNYRNSTTVHSGTTATRVAVNSGGRMLIFNGGTATQIKENGGYVNAEEGAEVSFVKNSLNKLYVSGSSASVHSNTTATGTTVAGGGALYVFTGGTVSDTAMIVRSYLEVGRGGVANNTIQSHGSAGVFGTANSNTILGGWMAVRADGVVSDTIVKGSGSLYVNGSGSGSRCGSANQTTVESGGLLYLEGAVKNTTVVLGGTMTMRSGGVTEGRLNLAAGAVVTAQLGAVIDFTVAEQSAPSTALINNWSLISGGADATYTITVKADQANGTYILADGAVAFAETISVKTTDNTTLGTLSVGDTKTFGTADYTLTKVNDILALTISSEPKLSYFVTGDFAGVGSDYLGKEGDSDSVLHIYQTGAEWGSTPMEENWKFYDSVDFNGDGKADLLRSNETSRVVVGEVSNGNGSFTPQVLNALGDGWQILGTGDFNGNGVGDVLVANPTAASATVGLLGYWEGGTVWNLINGYSAEWEMVSTNDFNGDGKTDMLWKNEFIGEGGKTYNAYCTWIVDNANDWRMVSVANPDEWNFLCTGDFDGDNTADIAMINGEGVVGIWGIQDGYLSSWSILSAVDTSIWNLAGSGDFNGDGTDDIAWCNADTNLAGYWQINNKQLTSWQTIATLA